MYNEDKVMFVKGLAKKGGSVDDICYLLLSLVYFCHELHELDVTCFLCPSLSHICLRPPQAQILHFGRQVFSTLASGCLELCLGSFLQPGPYGRLSSFAHVGAPLHRRSDNPILTNANMFMWLTLASVM